MNLKVIGAGLGRTGTYSLKLGLERLLSQPCYHMMEVFQHPEHIPIWQAAAEGKPVDWPALFEGYAATVDWPSGSFYKEQMEVFPEAIVVHSVRDPESWWNSASETIFAGIGSMSDRDPAWFAMVSAIFENRFTTEFTNKQACIDAFNRHNDAVAKVVPADRLVVWRATDGWEPLCKALNLPVPSEPFPKANTKEEFIARIKERAAH